MPWSPRNDWLSWGGIEQLGGKQLRRRDYLRATLATLGGLLSPWRTPHAKASTSSADQVVGSGFGHWINPNQLPAFVYQKPLVPETPRHWHLFGNRAIQVLARTDGNLGLFEERQGMRLQNHSAHYPDAWAGTLSGPDAWNGPEASRPGATWITDAFAMQDFPVANLHVHAQPLLAYQRLHGVTPTAAGTLAAPSALGTLRAR